MKQSHAQNISEPLQRILEARHHDPFEVLGRHVEGDSTVFRVFQPRARRVRLGDAETELQRIEGTDLFEGRFNTADLPERIEVIWADEYGVEQQHYDPYCFTPQLQDFDVHLFGEGRHRHAYRFLGAHPHEADEIPGILFAVWAPNAERISIVGDFNQWDGRVYPMRARGGSGIWELFIPGLATGAFYKFEVRAQDGDISLRTDPYGNHFQMRPETAAVVMADSEYQWEDEDWIEAREKRNWQQSPMSVYEVHLGSWQKDIDGGFLNYRKLAHRLCDHIKETGFTHVELLPITEHPFDGSWGYQTTGYFAPTSRFGTPDDFRYFIDHLHKNSIGVILDWVPAHFPRDRHALAQFDGSALYEHEDPRRGEHRDWGTLIFNFGRNEVRNFLISSAIYWMEEFHLDGLRVDAVASMLYLDYSREPGDWLPNEYGGRENLEAVDFMRELNSTTHELHPGTLMIAEESTAWPQVSRPTWLGGLGFSMKWNMGWMHDTLSYLSKDPVYRHYHHDLLTFGLLYAFTENFVLPFSHDEVVHGKGSMINKMPGDEWQKFAALRLLYTYMFTYPGKKLLFMGSEFAQAREWNDDEALDWFLLDHPFHNGVKTLISDLNHLYQEQTSLHQVEFEEGGFEWIDCNDSSQSVLSYLRKSPDGNVAVIILNFTPIPRENYRIGLSRAGNYREVLNSDSAFYGGSNVGNGGVISAEEVSWMGRDYSASLTLPPLGAVVLRLEV
ncbi:1,4-alpha-glucan branching protein GlgB [endosymbiont of Lamellibrachia barhami]|uniref:1,4-alpha-glucan branching protein GlgB n=1 Tax=endosymbiont of Lamellibrachia barhami TaxID=205975 RepID=UPI0015A98040|nr:1,4-alpha-glucan branching protein GlgB [endosymbiont of Lamellibrachia barhami]